MNFPKISFFRNGLINNSADYVIMNDILSPALGKECNHRFGNRTIRKTRTKRFIRSEAKSKLFVRTELYINKQEF